MLILMVGCYIALPMDFTKAKDNAAGGALSGAILGVSFGQLASHKFAFLPGAVGLVVGAVSMGTIGIAKEIISEINHHPSDKYMIEKPIE
jgi:hypothetical protein